MVTISREVRKMQTQEHSAAKLLVGHRLNEHERVIVHLLDLRASEDVQPVPVLPDWCKVYEGLTEAEIEDIEQSITRCNLPRTFE